MKVYKLSANLEDLLYKSKKALIIMLFFGVLLMSMLVIYSAFLNSKNSSFQKEIKTLKNENEKLSLQFEKIKGSYSLSEKAKALGMVEADNIDYLVSKKASSFALR